MYDLWNDERMQLVECLADSVTETGERCTSLKVTFPRFILAEMNTHRMFSRNTSSSRAIPIQKTLAAVTENPVLPYAWGKNRPGMQAEESIEKIDDAQAIWEQARDHAVSCARQLADLGVHKQIVNRLIEPFLWTTMIITATEWENFFTLRCSPNAQPEMQATAEAMRDCYRSHAPTLVPVGGWHLPLGSNDDPSPIRAAFRSAAQCARISYTTTNTKTAEEDYRLANDLAANRHLSPFEHPATPAAGRHDNLIGWKSLRSILAFYL